MACLQTEPVAVYRPRRAVESDLHRLVRQHWDDLRAAWPHQYARTHGHWRPTFDRAVRAFLKCGDLQHGFARVRCPDCRHEFFVAFSCKQRCICPSCSQKRTLLFGMHVAEDVCLNVLQHIPDKGEHPIRYYGYYSNKARGMRANKAREAEGPDDPRGPGDGDSRDDQQPPLAKPAPLDRRRWAMLIKKIYHADPLRCPRCGGAMKIIAFIEARQGDLVRKILEHCGLWHDPPPRAPPTIASSPTPGPKVDGLLFEPSSSLTYEVDPDFLEYQRREDQGQPDLPFEP